jgi:hypothetical protein
MQRQGYLGLENTTGKRKIETSTQITIHPFAMEEIWQEQL